MQDLKTVIETCSVLWTSKYTEGAYIMFHLSTQFLIPLLVLIYFYSKIFLTVSKNIRHKNNSLRIERENSTKYTTKTLQPRASTSSASCAQIQNLLETSDRKNSMQDEKNKLKKKYKINFIRKCFRKTSCKNQRNFKNGKKLIVYYSRNDSNASIRSSFSSKKFSTTYNSNENHGLLSGVKQNFKTTTTTMTTTQQFNKYKMPTLRQNYTGKDLSKSKMKTLKLTLTVVFAYVICSLPFYVCTLINLLFDISSKTRVPNVITQTLSKSFL